MLNYLRITNWKAFEDKSFEFTEGMNFLVGENGVGKTTVLEAICLAMSGDTTHPNFLGLVRDRAIPAKIELRFRLDGQDHEIIRQFSHKSRQKSELISENRTVCTNWDPVSLKTMELLGIESAFFRRLIYMSEGEIYRYLREPPDEALNRRIQYIFGIDNLLAAESLLKRVRLSFTSQLESVEADLEKLRIRPEKTAKDVSVLEEELSKLRESKRKVENKRISVDEKILKTKDLITWFRKAKDTVEELISTIRNEKKRLEAKQHPLKAAAQLIEDSNQLINLTENNLIQTQRDIGKSENKKKYFEDIKKLLRSLEDEMNRQTSVICPVCKRPITKEMGIHLIVDTDKEIKQAENELSEISKKNQVFEAELQTQREVKSLREKCAIQLNNIPAPVLEEASRLSLAQIEDRIKALEGTLSNCHDDIKTIEEANAKVQGQINAKIQEISDSRAEHKNILLEQDLRNRLVKAHKGEMLASISASALKNTVIDVRNMNLEPLFDMVGDLFRSFRPERKWRVRQSLKGKIEIEDKSKKLGYEDLSGGEKTVLLVLARVILCKALSRVKFLMIDEPLEHLDIRNRRSLINFLSIANKRRIIPQIIVTTFEETLLRKYFYDRSVKTEFLR